MDKKRLVALAAGVLILLILFYQSTVFLESRDALREVTSLNEASANLVQRIADYYEDDETGYPVSSLTQGDLTRLEQRIQTLEKAGDRPLPQVLYDEFDDLTTRYQAIQGLNSLFEEESSILDGVSVRLYREDISLDLVEEVRAEIYFSPPKDAFHNQINFQLRWIEQELKSYNQALEHLEDVNHIPIRSRNYALIARTYQKVQDYSGDISNPLLVNNFREENQAFIDKFVDAAVEQWDPEIAVWALRQLEPAPVLEDQILARLEEESGESDD